MSAELDLPPVLQSLLDTEPAAPGSVLAADRIDYDHDGTALSGVLVRDTAMTGRRPGVLVLHDWTGEGPYVRARAAMLARLGYVAFAADLYGAGVRPQGDAAAAAAGRYYGDLPLLRERVRAAYDVLAADPEVDPDRIVVIGYCFGGSAAIEFARTGAPAAGVVSFHGSLIAHEPADVAAIRAPLLVLTGGDDPVVPDEAVVRFEDELRQAPGVDWQVVTYSGAPHAFTLPGIPNHRPVADARSWRAMRGFIDEVAA